MTPSSIWNQQCEWWSSSFTIYENTFKIFECWLTGYDFLITSLCALLFCPHGVLSLSSSPFLWARKRGEGLRLPHFPGHLNLTACSQVSAPKSSKPTPSHGEGSDLKPEVIPHVWFAGVCNFSCPLVCPLWCSVLTGTRVSKNPSVVASGS